MGGGAPTAGRHEGRRGLTAAARNNGAAGVVWRAMKSTITTVVIFFAIVVAVAGCAGAPVPPSDLPGSLPPDAPIGVLPPDGSVGGGGAPPFAPGQPALLVPKPGQQNVHDVAVEQLTATVVGRRVVVTARWWSGVEPCSVLDSVAVTKNGATVTVAVREGSGNKDAACPDLAMLKATAIDLGDLVPGDYTVVVTQGPAPGIVVTVR
jgi:hypothetical protein